MSAVTTLTGGMLITQFDYSKLFIWNPKTRTGTYTNGTGGTVDLLKGRIFGRIAANNRVTPQVSTAIDGSQVPRFILANDYLQVANGATITVTFAISGEIAREGVIFGGSDTYATVITLNDSAVTPNTTAIGTIEDLLWNAGLQTVATTENTYPDNG